MNSAILWEVKVKMGVILRFNDAFDKITENSIRAKVLNKPIFDEI